MSILVGPVKARVLMLFVLIFVCQLQMSSSAGTMERTLGMIKPDGLAGNYDNRIKKVILESGFSILREMTVQLDEDRAEKFYEEHSSRSFFTSLVEYMTSGPVMVLLLEKENAVDDWRSLIGPTDARKAKVNHPHSIRALCGLDLEKNCIHGSDSLESAEREISFFFTDIHSDVAASEHDEL